MKIRYTYARGVNTAAMPKGDPLTVYAAESYGFALNTPARAGKWHTPREFAEAIREVFDCEEEPRNAAIVSHLEALTV